jgi:hypothetical protein
MQIDLRSLICKFKYLEKLTVNFLNIQNLYKHDNPYFLTEKPIEIDTLKLITASMPAIKWLFRRVLPKKVLNLKRCVIDPAA